MAAHPADFLRAAVEMDSQMGHLARPPMLFLEYSAGLAPEAFAGLFHQIRDLTRISACLDTGHVGMRQVRQAFSRSHPGEDIGALRPNRAGGDAVIADVERAVSTALPGVLDLIEALARPGKPVHFHLHDGHPWSRISPYGVSDHLSFLRELPLGWAHRGRRSLALMFGPVGLARIVARAAECLGLERASFTLEIHPTSDRSPLVGEAARLFAHWQDKTHAEQMNHWLSVLAQNHLRLLEALPPGGRGR
jgi:hypothetical protein